LYRYSEAFRSSPFFWAFQKVLPGGRVVTPGCQDWFIYGYTAVIIGVLTAKITWKVPALPGGEELASQIFKFTAGLPVAGTRGPFGTIAQTISLVRLCNSSPVDP
jgi:hypothetical protein